MLLIKKKLFFVFYIRNIDPGLIATSCTRGFGFLFFLNVSKFSYKQLANISYRCKANQASDHLLNSVVTDVNSSYLPLINYSYTVFFYKKTSKYTLLRSVFVDKKSRDQLARAVYKAISISSDLPIFAVNRVSLHRMYELYVIYYFKLVSELYSLVEVKSASLSIKKR